MPSERRPFDRPWLTALLLSIAAHLATALVLATRPEPPAPLVEEQLRDPDRFVQLMLELPSSAPPPARKPPRRLTHRGGGGPALPAVAAIPRRSPRLREQPMPPRSLAGGPGLLGALAQGAPRTWQGTSVERKGGAASPAAPGGGGDGGASPVSGRSLGIGVPDRPAGAGRAGEPQPVSLPRVSLTDVETRGCIRRREVERLADRVQSQVKYCYIVALRDRPDLGGHLTTALEIAANGAVRSVDVRSDTLGVPEVAACVARVLGRLRFAPCGGSSAVEVVLPWHFRVAAG